MTKLPPGLKLVNTHSSNGYAVLLNGASLGSVYPCSRTYNISPKAFVLRWWEVRLPNTPYPLGVEPARLAQGHSAHDQAEKFDTRALAIAALLSLTTPPLDSPAPDLLA